jgi:hypothetical protein
MSKARFGTTTFSVDLPPDVIDLARRRARADGETLVQYIEGLIRQEATIPVFEAAIADQRVGGAVANALGALGRGDVAMAEKELTFARGVILEHFKTTLCGPVRTATDLQMMRDGKTDR